MKRSGKFYRKNEAEVMKSLGLAPTKNSGSGWIEKEDGQSEHIVCQLKSTDANSIKINKKDLDTLQYNASVSHKIPVFAIQFLQSNEVYLVIKPEDIQDIVEYINTGDCSRLNAFLDVVISEHEEYVPKPVKSVKSAYNAREMYTKANESKYKKKVRKAN